METELPVTFALGSSRRHLPKALTTVDEPSRPTQHLLLFLWLLQSGHDQQEDRHESLIALCIGRRHCSSWSGMMCIGGRGTETAQGLVAPIIGAPRASMP